MKWEGFRIIYNLSFRVFLQNHLREPSFINDEYTYRWYYSILAFLQKNSLGKKHWIKVEVALDFACGMWIDYKSELENPTLLHASRCVSIKIAFYWNLIWWTSDYVLTFRLYVIPILSFFQIGTSKPFNSKSRFTIKIHHRFTKCKYYIRFLSYTILCICIVINTE